jgi:hypothetical protein
MRKNFSISKVLIAVCIVMMLLSIMPTAPVLAGTNGQQLLVWTRKCITMECNTYYCCPFQQAPGFRKVTVSGKNQNGNSSTYSWSGNNALGVMTIGYWWVGQVVINVELTNGDKKKCVANIPKNYYDNYYWVNCGV